MKREVVEGGILWTNDGTIPEGIYDNTNLIVLQPGEHFFVPDVAAPEGDLGAVAAYAKARYEGKI